MKVREPGKLHQWIGEQLASAPRMEDDPERARRLLRLLGIPTPDLQGEAGQPGRSRLLQDGPSH